MRLVLFCAHDNSAYAANILRAAQESGISFSGIVIRETFSLGRLKEEVRFGFWPALRKVLQLAIRMLVRPLSITDGFVKYSNVKKFDIAPVSQYALNMGIEFIKVESLNEEKITSFLDEVEAEVGVFAGGGIVRKHLIHRLPIINCHMGVLPMYRGHFPWVWAILARDFNEIGLTLHIMDTGIDTGPILEVRRCKLRAGWSCSDVRSNLEYCMTDFLVNFLDRIKCMRLDDIPKQHQRDSDGLQFFIPHEALVQKADRILRGEILR